MILIHAGRVLEPAEGLDLRADIALSGNRIAGIFPTDQGGAEGTPGFSLRKRAYRQITGAERLVAAPELVDVHVRFRDPGPTYKEDIHTRVETAAGGGFITVVCIANTNPVVDSEGILCYVLEEGKKTGIHVLSCTAVSEGLAGRELTDMEGLLTAGAAGFTDDGIPLTGGMFVRVAMEEAARLDTVLSLHEEDKYFIRENGVNYGGISNELGICGSSVLVEDPLVARDCMITLDTGITVDTRHISPGHSVEVVCLVERSGAKVWAEVTPHHFILAEEIALKCGTLAKMNPPLRTEKDRQISIEGPKDGTIDMITMDRAPHSRGEKERPLTQTPSGMLGLEIVLVLGATSLVRADHLTLLEFMEKMNFNPARLYKLGCERMEPGTPVDLVLFDADGQRTVEGSESKSANSPFLSETLTGRVMYTVYGGKVVYREQKAEV